MNPKGYPTFLEGGPTQSGLRFLPDYHTNARAPNQVGCWCELDSSSLIIFLLLPQSFLSLHCGWVQVWLLIMHLLWISVILSINGVSLILSNRVFCHFLSEFYESHFHRIMRNKEKYTSHVRCAWKSINVS